MCLQPLYTSNRTRVESKMENQYPPTGSPHENKAKSSKRFGEIDYQRKAEDGCTGSLAVPAAIEKGRFKEPFPKPVLS